MYFLPTDEVCNSDRCNIVVVCVFVSKMFISLFTLGGLSNTSNTRRFAVVRVGEVFIVVVHEDNIELNYIDYKFYNRVASKELF
jgi:hypothetical protein